MEKRSCGNLASSARTKEVLPAPDGAATTNSSPRRPGTAVASSALMSIASFDVLNLLAHLLDRDLHVHRGARGVHVLRLGGERIGFAVQRLHQKIQAASSGLRGVEHARHLIQVCCEPIELLV